MLLQLPESPGLQAVTATVRDVLALLPAYDAKSDAHASLVIQASGLLQRMLNGEKAMNVLNTLQPQAPILIPADKIEEVIRAEVASVEAIDLHTHLFPPSHTDLMLWGIDDLLTYHYLVAEYFQTSPMSHAKFFELKTREQATLVWQGLFIDRLPISEACRGVCTTLTRLGLEEELKQRDLAAIRAYFDHLDPNEYVETVYKLAGLKYVVMTNIPFRKEEAIHWKQNKVFNRGRFRTCLRLDAVFLGDWVTVSEALEEGGYPQTLEGARQYLRDWAKVLKPEYLMASTPDHYDYDPSKPITMPEEKSTAQSGPSPAKKAKRSVPTVGELVKQVVMVIAEELDLPIAMKFGACRGLNPNLNPCGGGDGVTREGGGAVQYSPIQSNTVQYSIIQSNTV